MRFRAKIWSIVIVAMCIFPIFAMFFTEKVDLTKYHTFFNVIEQNCEDLMFAGYIPDVIRQLFLTLQGIGINIPQYIRLIFSVTVMVELAELFLEAILFLPRLCKKLMKKFEEK